MTSEGGINRGGKYPKLCDIDHDEHDQSCLPYCRLPRFRTILHIHSFDAEALLPVAQTCPSRVSTWIVSNARGGGP